MGATPAQEAREAEAHTAPSEPARPNAVSGLVGLAGPSRVLALQRTVGNAAVSRLIAVERGRAASRPLQRQATSDPTQADLTGQQSVYMLKPPKVIKQHSLTCWAAALSSFLDVVGTQQISIDQILLRYITTACIDEDNALPNEHAADVFAEWGVEFKYFEPPHKRLTGPRWRERLREHGHLLLATRGDLGHVVVVYGSGFNDKGEPDSDWISVMDPIVGEHRNWHISAVADTISIGWLTTKRTRPAPCLSKPAPAPPEEPAPTPTP